MSAPIMLLQTFLQTRVTASASGSSVTFTETNTAVAQSTGLSLVLSNLESPFPGTQFSGAAGTVSSTPIKINVASLSGGGVVQGIEIRAVSDPTLPATATCTGGNSILTDTQGNAVCTLQFGSTEGQGKVKSLRRRQLQRLWAVYAAGDGNRGQSWRSRNSGHADGSYADG